ncbi:MAG: DUF4124 domain-containing protein [Pseudomonadales bacterium]
MFHLNRYLLSACFFTAMALLPVSSQADVVYRWVDNENIVHYSERPPKGIKSTRIKTSSGSSSAVKKDSLAAPQSEQEAKRKLAEASTPNPRKNKEVCERASFNYKLLNERARIKQKDDKGEVRYLSDEEKEEQKKSAKVAMDTYC